MAAGAATVVVRRCPEPCDRLIPDRDIAGWDIADGDIADWDALVAATAGTDVTQLSSWARIRSVEGFRPTYLLARRGPALVGGAQILLRQVRGLGHVGYVPYGPLVATSSADRADTVRTLAVALAQLRDVRMLFVQPPEGTEDLRCALLAVGFRPSSAGIAPTGSMRIDLTASLDEIRDAFSSRLRYWTRRWADRGVTVRRGDENDVPLLADLMRSAAEARGYHRPPRLDYLLAMYTELADNGNAALFVGAVDGRPVTADLVTMCGEMVRGRLGGFDRSCEGRRLSVPAAARWEIIRWAKRSGYRWLDFGGLSEPALRDAVDNGLRRSPSWPGSDQAKMAFGGIPFRYPAPIEMISPRPLRCAYEATTRSGLGRVVIDRAGIWLRSGPRQQRPRSPAATRPAKPAEVP